jgi:hypothetical protein
VGLGRYLLHVPSLPALLPNASALRPKLALQDELVRAAAPAAPDPIPFSPRASSRAAGAA